MFDECETLFMVAFTFAHDCLLNLQTLCCDLVVACTLEHPQTSKVQIHDGKIRVMLKPALRIEAEYCTLSKEAQCRLHTYAPMGDLISRRRYYAPRVSAAVRPHEMPM